MKNAGPQTSETGTVDKCEFNSSAIKATLLTGRSVRLIDFKEELRASVIGIIAGLRDELPIGCRWVTIRESHLSETRLRCRTYRIDGAFLLATKGEPHGN